MTAQAALDRFVAEVPLLTSQPDKPEPLSTPRAADKVVKGTQQLLLHVPSPRTEIRLGEISKDGKHRGLHAYTEAEVAIAADGDVSVVAGQEKAVDDIDMVTNTVSAHLGDFRPFALGLSALRFRLTPGAFTKVGLAVGMLQGANKGLEIADKTDLLPFQGDNAGRLILAAKKTASISSNDTMYLTCTTSGTMWAGATLRAGANGSVNIDGGIAAAVSGGAWTTVVAGRRLAMASGWRTELASRWGFTRIRGAAIELGLPSKRGSLRRKFQVPTLRVALNADDDISLRTGYETPLGPGSSFNVRPYMITAFTRTFGVAAEAIRLCLDQNARIDMTSSALVLQMDKTLTASTKARQAADKARRDAEDGAMVAWEAAAGAAMAAGAAWRVAYGTTRKVYEASMAAADAAEEASINAAEMAQPTIKLAPTSVAISTSALNKIEIDQVGGILLKSGAGSIEMSPAGIVLKFGASKVTLGVAGVEIDAGPGLIKRKGTLATTM